MKKQENSYEILYNYVLDHMEENDSDYGFHIEITILDYVASVTEEEIDAKELEYKKNNMEWLGREAYAAKAFTDDLLSLTYSDLEEYASIMAENEGEEDYTPEKAVEDFNFEVSNTDSEPLHPANNH